VACSVGETDVCSSAVFAEVVPGGLIAINQDGVGVTISAKT
jgi:hypothetical protein